MRKSLKEVLLDCVYMTGAGFFLCLGAYVFFLVLRFMWWLV